MRYSIVNRFRGTLLGAFLGESLGDNDAKQSQRLETLPATSLHWGKILVLGAESLIETGHI